MNSFLARQSEQHGINYSADVPAYLFALHTYIAIVAKVVAALALPHHSEDIGDARVPIKERMAAIESGKVFADAGIVNMLAGDFFSWYVDDSHWPQIDGPLAVLVAMFRDVSFDLTRKKPESIRDLFKGIYETFVPRELRHALGEVYTPDWLASHALDQMGWTPNDQLLDPTCGTGTFLLEALKRRIIEANVRRRRATTAEDLLKGIYGIDLNPLAVLAAKASMIVVLADRLSADRPVVLPVFLADAINSANPTADGFFVHSLQTEIAVLEFEIPASTARGSSRHLRNCAG